MCIYVIVVRRLPAFDTFFPLCNVSNYKGWAYHKKSFNFVEVIFFCLLDTLFGTFTCCGGTVCVCSEVKFGCCFDSSSWAPLTPMIQPLVCISSGLGGSVSPHILIDVAGLTCCVVFFLISFHCNTMGGFKLSGRYKFLISLTKLSATQCFPLLLRCRPCLVWCSLSVDVLTTLTRLNGVIRPRILLLKSFTSMFTHEERGRSYLRGASSRITLVLSFVQTPSMSKAHF